MAKSATISVNNSTPTMLYSGDGLVAILIANSNFSDCLLLGGSDVSQSNGVRSDLLAAAKMLPVRIESEDEIWGLMKTTGAGSSMDVQVFSVR